MARNVLHAASGLRTAVVAPAHAADVRRFALINGARFFSEPDDGGVNGALSHGVEQLRDLGYTRVIIAMGDLPLVKDLRWLENENGISVVADRTGKGTNAISLPTDVDFNFTFGSGSFERHQAEAARLGHVVIPVVDPDGVSSDVDEIDDAMRTGVFLADDPITMEHDVVIIDDNYGSRRHARKA